MTDFTVTPEMITAVTNYFEGLGEETVFYTPQRAALRYDTVVCDGMFNLDDLIKAVAPSIIASVQGVSK